MQVNGAFVNAYTATKAADDAQLYLLEFNIHNVSVQVW